MFFWALAAMLFGLVVWLSRESPPPDVEVIYRLPLRPWAHRLFRFGGLLNYVLAALILLLAALNQFFGDRSEVATWVGLATAVAAVGLTCRTFAERKEVIFTDRGVYYFGRVVERDRVSCLELRRQELLIRDSEGRTLMEIGGPLYDLSESGMGACLDRYPP